jgi:hypothetical protein
VVARDVRVGVWDVVFAVRVARRNRVDGAAVRCGCVWEADLDDVRVSPLKKRDRVEEPQSSSIVLSKTASPHHPSLPLSSVLCAGAE